MVISSIIVKCINGAEEVLPTQLEQIGGVTVEGIHNGDIILVLESSSLDAAVHILETEITPLSGVIGAYPVYVNTDCKNTI